MKYVVFVSGRETVQVRFIVCLYYVCIGNSVIKKGGEESH